MMSRQGFTLIELLVALVIVGLIAVLASGAVRLGLRSNERLLQQAEVTEDRRVLQGQLRAWLESAEPAVVDDPSRPAVPLLGASDGMEFSAAMPAGDGVSGLWRVRLSARDGWLVIDRQRIVEDRLADKIETIGLYPRIAAIHLAYSDGGGWLDSWDAPTRLPRKIRVSIDRSEPGEPPETLVVAPAIARGPR